MKEKIYRKIFNILEANENTSLSKRFSLFLSSLIILNLISVILESENQLAEKYTDYFSTFELFSIIIFTIEYLLRVISCTQNYNYRSPIWGRIKFMLSPLAILDLLAIIPFYLPVLINLDLRFIRALRLLRLIRVFKLGHYSTALKIIGKVLSNKKEELLISIMAIFIILIISSALMYYVEKDYQPNTFSSILSTMWWGVVTLTTVGYGDVYPISPLGKLISSLIAILGIGLFALPAGILASGFSEEMQKEKRPQKCPHCGKEIKNL